MTLARAEDTNKTAATTEEAQQAVISRAINPGPAGGADKDVKAISFKSRNSNRGQPGDW